MNLRRNFLKTALLAATVAPLSAVFTPAAAVESKVQLMFVQSAESLKADDKTLRLVNASPQTICFADRPVRDGGAHHDGGLPQGVDCGGWPEQLQQNPAQRDAIGL